MVPQCREEGERKEERARERGRKRGREEGGGGLHKLEILQVRFSPSLLPMELTSNAGNDPVHRGARSPARLTRIPSPFLRIAHLVLVLLSPPSHLAEMDGSGRGRRADRHGFGGVVVAQVLDVARVEACILCGLEEGVVRTTG